MSILRRSLMLTTACLALATPFSVLAQAWPTKQPIKFVAVFPPGGSVDQVARILQGPLQQQLGQSIIVENKGGASGSIGTAQVAASAPDGYTLFMATAGPVTVAHSLQPRLAYRPTRDFAPVIHMVDTPMSLITANSVPARSVNGPLRKDLSSFVASISSLPPTSASSIPAPRSFCPSSASRGMRNRLST